MARKSVIVRQQKRERIVAKYAKQRKHLKEAIRKLKAANEGCQEEQRALQSLPRDASPVRLRNRCKLTGRPRGVYRKFGLARNVLRIRAMRGEFPGLAKSSW